jgi:SNF2 family DNA or RNA helicase
MEIARFTEEGALSVKVYHGSNRSCSLQDITDADVVLTSYQVVRRILHVLHLVATSVAWCHLGNRL